MSIIVVVKKAGKVVIAADTLSTFGNTKLSAKYQRDRSKVLRCGSAYIGIAGSAAHNNVLRSIIKKHGAKLSFKSTADIFETYRKLHPILKSEYYLNTSESDHDEYESSQMDALIASPQGIFGMYSWREIYEYDRFWAIGSGSDYALGAMYAAYEGAAMAEEVAGIGVNAGCEFDDGSSLPFTMQSLKMSKTRSNHTT